MAPPATADPIETVDAAASGRPTSQHLTVSAVVAAASLDRDDPVASAVAGIIAGHGGRAGERAADAIVDALAAGGVREKVVATALTYLGDPYVLDGADHSGIDCSGLVMEAYGSVGIHLGHLVHLQDDTGRRIDEADARPGDLVVFDDEEHIALYLGGGMIVQAPEVGRPVEVTTVWSGVPHHFTTLLGAVP
jgi:cell wall-associated NlpC family hydrolase